MAIALPRIVGNDSGFDRRRSLIIGEMLGSQPSCDGEPHNAIRRAANAALSFKVA